MGEWIPLIDQETFFTFLGIRFLSILTEWNGDSLEVKVNSNLRIDSYAYSHL